MRVGVFCVLIGFLSIFYFESFVLANSVEVKQNYLYLFSRPAEIKSMDVGHAGLILSTPFSVEKFDSYPSGLSHKVFTGASLKFAKNLLDKAEYVYHPISDEQKTQLLKLVLEWRSKFFTWKPSRNCVSFAACVFRQVTGKKIPTSLIPFTSLLANDLKSVEPDNKVLPWDALKTSTGTQHFACRPTSGKMVNSFLWDFEKKSMLSFNTAKKNPLNFYLESFENRSLGLYGEIMDDLHSIRIQVKVIKDKDMLKKSKVGQKDNPELYLALGRKTEKAKLQGVGNKEVRKSWMKKIKLPNWTESSNFKGRKRLVLDLRLEESRQSLFSKVSQLIVSANANRDHHLYLTSSNGESFALEYFRVDVLADWSGFR